MAHFYGVVEGRARTLATRCGTKYSGISAHISSWNKGVFVECIYNEELHKNIFKVYVTGGSNNQFNTQCISEIEEILPPKNKRFIKEVGGWAEGIIKTCQV